MNNENICFICKRALSSLPLSFNIRKINQRGLPQKTSEIIVIPCECANLHSHKYCLILKIIIEISFKCNKCNRYYNISFINETHSRIIFIIIYTILYFIVNIIILIVCIILITINILDDKFIFNQYLLCGVLFIVNILLLYRNIQSFNTKAIFTHSTLTVDNYQNDNVRYSNNLLIDGLIEKFANFLIKIYNVENAKELYEIKAERESEMNKRKSNMNKVTEYIYQNNSAFRTEEEIDNNDLLNIVSIKTKRKQTNSHNKLNYNEYSSICVNVITSEPNEMSDSPINRILSGKSPMNNIQKIRTYQNPFLLGLRSNANFLCLNNNSIRHSPSNNDKTPGFRTITESSCQGSNHENVQAANGNVGLLSSFRDEGFIKVKSNESDDKKNK